MRFGSIFLFLGTSLLPVYAFASGGVQPAHMLLACFAGLTLLSRDIPISGWSLALLGISIYSFIVESFYIIVGGHPEVLIHSIFFLYNFFLTCAVYLYVRQYGLSSLMFGIFVAGTIALVTVLQSGVDLRSLAENGRSTGTFNNPNQLGYFSVCLLSLTYLFYRHGRISYFIAVSMFSVSIFLAISSLSKAAMVANFVVALFALKPASSRNSLLIWSAMILAGSAVLFHQFNAGAFDEYLFMQRLASIAQESDSSLEARGYFAFLEGNAAQFLFGLGTQGVDAIVGHEVHSTIGSIFNTYGFIGFSIFMTALFLWMLQLWRGYRVLGLLCIAGPAILYGITHNGTRFTIFWLLFAASMAMAENEQALRRILRTRWPIVHGCPTMLAQRNS